MGRLHFAAASLVLALVACAALGRQDDVCGAHNGRRLYLELGDRGVLTARDLAPPQRSANVSHERCSLELVTCPSCVVAVSFRRLGLPHRCGGSNVVVDGACRCDYVWLSEPPNGGSPFCGVVDAPTPGGPFYRSQTRTLSIVLLYSEAHQHAFTLEYSSERNRQQLKGSLSASGKPVNESRGGVLASPFFPSAYPRDLGVEYVVACQPEAGAGCRVRLIFRDFQLAALSIMEFYDWNGHRLEVSGGNVFRPPVILTTGPQLVVRFYANGGTGLGYKAIYSFIYGNLGDDIAKPSTDCGGYVENFGGAITMMKMVDQGAKTFDCVWLIRPPRSYAYPKTHVLLKVASFVEMAGSTELQVLQGMTSESAPMQTLRTPAAQPPRGRELLIPADIGFYVSLRGAFGPTSRLAIVYASYSYTDCFTGSDFLCQNHRCIPVQLSCDGFDHCGDNSDEPASCPVDSELDRKSRHGYAHTPNYYFPKNERFPDLKTATMVFVASSLGMVLLISALVILLYHMGNRARQQRDLQSQLQTISELLDGAHSSASSPRPDEPPSYEPPPDYDQIIKVGLEPAHCSARRRRRRERSTRRRSRSSPPAPPGRLPLPATAEGGGVSRSCQTTPLPESPPPPYLLAPPQRPLPPPPVPPPLAGLAHRSSWLQFSEEDEDHDETPPTPAPLPPPRSCTPDSHALYVASTPSSGTPESTATVLTMSQYLQMLSDSEDELQSSRVIEESLANDSFVNFDSLLGDPSAPDEQVTRFVRSLRDVAAQRAETNRMLAEMARAAVESVRATAESSRAQAELSRGADAGRASVRGQAESSRAPSELSQVQPEASQVPIELSRGPDEFSRASVELDRSSAEPSRVVVEMSRVAAEAGRFVSCECQGACGCATEFARRMAVECEYACV